MPSLYEYYRSRNGGGLADYYRGRGRSRGRGTTLPELQQQVSELEAYQQATGAPQIEQERPGFLYRTIDALSGFNYAMAGAYEEIAKGGDAIKAVSRFGAEIYSSARSLPLGQLLPKLGGAEKKAFGEVLEGLGYSTKTLADAVPMMEGTFLGNLINTRGTVGIALDIAADPLTYLSFGLSAVARRTLPKFAALGMKYGLNPKGQDVFQAIGRELRASKEAVGLTQDAIEEMTARRLIDLGDASLFDQGGIKFGVGTKKFVVPGTPGVGKAVLEAMSEPVVRALAYNGLVGKAARTADTYWDALKAIGRETWGEFGPLERLTGPLREEARRVGRKYIQAPAMLYGRYVQRVKGSEFYNYFKSNPGKLEAWWKAIDAGDLAGLGETERKLADELAALTGEVGAEAVALDILKEGQVAANPNYILHSYVDQYGRKLSVADAMETWRLNNPGAAAVGNKHAMSKAYETMEEAARISDKRSKALQNLRKSGRPVLREVQLVPDYSFEAFESKLLGYLDWYSKKKASHIMARDFNARFGFDIAKWGDEVGHLIDGAQDYITTDHKEWEKVMGFFDDKRLGKLTEEAAWNPGKRGWIEGFEDVLKDAERRLTQISDIPAKKQFVKELLLRTDSVGQFANVWDTLERRGMTDLLPKTLLDLRGTTEDALKRFGEGAIYTAVGGNSLWGEGERMLPKLIVDYVENANSRILSSPDFKGWQKLVEKWHKANNVFKNWVYPFFPSSQVRNAYSNVYLSALRIGWHAIDPSLHMHSVGVLAGRAGELVTKTGRVYPYDEIRKIFGKENIHATFEQLTEQTGSGRTRIQRKTGLFGRYRQAITNVENEARYALGIQSLIDGLTAKEAAADVAEFLFNYNEVGHIHRKAQNFIPFVTFTTKNIRAQVNALRRTPGKVINQLKPFRGRKEENDQMVKFEAEGLKLRIDKDGKTVQVLTGIDLPLRNMDNIWAGGIGKTGMRIMGMMTPLIKAPVEVLTRRDFFTGSTLTRTQGNTIGRIMEATNTPKAIKDYFGYTKRMDAAGRPRYEFDAVKYQLFVRSWIFSRIVSTSDRQFREYLGDQNIAGAMIDVLTGLRMKDINMDEQQRQKLYRRRQQLQESLQRRGVLPVYSIPGKPNMTGLQ